MATTPLESDSPTTPIIIINQEDVIIAEEFIIPKKKSLITFKKEAIKAPKKMLFPFKFKAKGPKTKGTP